VADYRVKKVAFDDIAPNRKRGGDLRAMLTPSTVGAESGFMGVATLQPDEVITEHFHPYSEEFLYVAAGQLRVRLNGEPLDMHAGEAVLIPSGVRHRLHNDADEAATVVFFLSPLAPRPDLGHVDTETAPGAPVPVPVAGEAR